MIMNLSSLFRVYSGSVLTCLVTTFGFGLVLVIDFVSNFCTLFCLFSIE